MAVRKTGSGEWLCDLRPTGVKGKRIRRKFATKGEALAYEKYITSEMEEKPWLGEKQDNRRLSELIELWHDLYGRTLADSDRMMSKLKGICAGMGNPIAAQITAADFSKYREGRLKGEIPDVNGRCMPIQPQTVNHEQRNLSAVFGTLKKLGHWSLPNPLSGIPTFKVDEKMVSFLYPEEIKTLLQYLSESNSPSVLIIAKICLATGARWSEAENLEGSQVTPYRITYKNTKSRKVRSIPISKELYNEIPKKRGQLFTPCRKTFERTVAKAGIELPEGQYTHVLRHTFASHFMMNGGNILVLKEILGHSDIKMTMIYAHFAPTHLEDVITKNPLALIS
ncbi:TPA: tyrosine-type recombinase/integrase [Salmonella enterica subsp. enterica serovar Mississippi]|uniref:Tyrosine-type recombinase/integrase n=1 Tax=Salmonella enterica I TaxID=59201 RepID=A0A612QHB9_SALET|nr:tyrosine-type recombinase/integrase [Salmonella enterica]ECV9893359.1 tyrosine-type recombinase/integrase [Salmonella enterica subsp. enterica]ECV9897613.1 tyrosine-type recombinase/integrase [Salmonella enterica subsp. enterica]ECV9899862.1 tyrosine-type recombinase/integrase [Salmonella enterica subsp. enterica]ECV9906782.1 tyrosine-type recombinase/integrase [Salmonella enterica subsp. enterica]ECV9911944.1 tyrosine-type recombinase/integrase [Salmonella enterica subsp. enterica]